MVTEASVPDGLADYWYDAGRKMRSHFVEVQLTRLILFAV